MEELLEGLQEVEHLLGPDMAIGASWARLEVAVAAHLRYWLGAEVWESESDV